MFGQFISNIRVLMAGLGVDAGNLGVGGIESVIVEGKHLFFGYSYSGDMVMTPLFDEPDLMAAFASRHMRQTDGAHDIAYWRELVQEGAGQSNLTGDDAERTFTTADFQRFAAAVTAAEAGNRPVPASDIPERLVHLLVLVASARADATPWDLTAENPALTRFGLADEADSSIIRGLVEMLTGSRPLPTGASYTDAAAFLRSYLAKLVNNGLGNWRTRFQVLIPA